MRKLLALLLIIILSVGIFAACAGSSPELSANKKKEIEDAWLAWDGSELKWYDADDPVSIIYDTRYYGTYNGYDILFYPHSVLLDIVGGQTVAGKTFLSGSPFYLYAYRDGEFYQLEDIYNEGLITDEQISEILQTHNEFENAPPS